MKDAVQLPMLVSQLMALDAERVTVGEETVALDAKREALYKEALELEKKTKALDLREAEIDAALSEAAKKAKLTIPKIVRTVVQMLLREKEGFAPGKLLVAKPTEKDPIVTYDGITILWYLEI